MTVKLYLIYGEVARFLAIIFDRVMRLQANASAVLDKTICAIMTQTSSIWRNSGKLPGIQPVTSTETHDQ